MPRKSSAREDNEPVGKSPAFSPPTPLLDAREQALVARLAADYKRFVAPGRVNRSFRTVQAVLKRVVPGKLVKLSRDAIDAAAEYEFIKAAMERASRGFGQLTQQAARFALSHDGVLKAFRADGHSVGSFEEVCAMRSYHIERSLTRRAWKDRVAALAEGMATGAPGAFRIPFNLALSFLLYFRAAQSTGLYYGYDVRDDPAEMEFASEVTLKCLSATSEERAETIGSLIGKMMAAGELSALSNALSKTYGEMAARGGVQLWYVQVRALANKAAKTALEDSGKTGLEASVFRNLLEQVGKRLPKEAGKKAIPLIGAILGGGFDSWTMHRVLKGSNLIYHKRFLHEKEARVKLLTDSN